MLCYAATKWCSWNIIRDFVAYSLDQLVSCAYSLVVFRADSFCTETTKIELVKEIIVRISICTERYVQGHLVSKTTFRSEQETWFRFLPKAWVFFFFFCIRDNESHIYCCFLNYSGQFFFNDENSWMNLGNFKMILVKYCTTSLAAIERVQVIQ